VEICVFAIEMVYVPQSNYELGSGGLEVDHFYKYPTITDTYTISGESAIPVGTTNGNLYYASVWYGGDQIGPIPAEFPKGYNAYYIMKYEINQEQYVAFLNKLDTIQANNRYPNENGNFRHAITGSPGNYTTTNPYVACNYISWADLAAYFDWAAIRPITELELKKACRGTQTPVPYEYAWGTANISTNQYTLSNAGAGNEGIATNYNLIAGNINYSTTVGSMGGPLRCGIFSAHSNNTGRVTSGASYYGIMELSGNLWERAITVGNVQGRAFTGVNGDGKIDAFGDGNVINWPDVNAVGVGTHGGGFTFNAARCRTSYRFYAAFVYFERTQGNGGRGGRIAP